VNEALNLKQTVIMFSFLHLSSVFNLQELLPLSFLFSDMLRAEEEIKPAITLLDPAQFRKALLVGGCGLVFISLLRLSSVRHASREWHY